MSSIFYRQWLMLRKIPIQIVRQHGIGSKELMEYLGEQGFNLSQRQIQRDLKAFVELFDDLHTDGNKDRASWYWSKKSELLDLPGINPVVALSFKLTQQFLSEILPDSVQDTLSPYFAKSTHLLNSLKEENNLADWSDKVRITPRTQHLIPAKVSPEILHLVFQCLLEEKALEASYTRRNGEEKDYRINPLGLVFRQSVIYLVGTLWDYEDPLHFALHRIKDCAISNKLIHKPDGFNLDDYIATGTFDYADANKTIKLTAIFTNGAEIHLFETPLSDDQKAVKKHDGRVQITATVKDTSQLKWWLMGFGSNVEVVKPKSLRAEFIQMSNELQSLYQSE
ncbi:MAG: WYL domain-containing protein [Gammaproteobacteria bacterium]|nr:WYL domain-containing protein [Gammaproteobacteria bacterium]